MKIYVVGKEPESEVFNIEELEAGTVVRTEGSIQTYLCMVVQLVNGEGQKYGNKFLVDLRNGDVWTTELCEHDGLEVVDATIEIHEDEW